MNVEKLERTINSYILLIGADIRALDDRSEPSETELGLRVVVRIRNAAKEALFHIESYNDMGFRNNGGHQWNHYLPVIHEST